MINHLKLRAVLPRAKAVATSLACALVLAGCGGGSVNSLADGSGTSNVLPPGVVLAPPSPANPAGTLVAATQGSTLIRPTVEAAGAQCPAGGTRVDSGIDANGNGLLDAAEVAATAYVCNGLQGANGAPGATGLPGASGATGAAGSAGAAGPNGLAMLLRTSAEPAGANCTAGGVKVQAGLDADRNSVLAPNEVTTTSYVCNGINGTNGLNGAVGSGKNWQTAARIESGTPGGSPQVAFDGAGNATALWQGGGHLLASRNTAAAGWSVPVQVDAAGGAGTAKLAVNSQGTAIAAWLQLNAATSKFELWSARREGNTWRAPVRINTGATNDALDVALAINSSGDVTAIWYDKAANGKIDVKARRYQVFISDWDATVATLQLDTAGVPGQVYGLSVAMDDTSAAVAAYTRDAGQSIVIDTRRYNPATGWDSGSLAATLTCFFRLCSQPKVLMNNNGHALMVWAVNDMPGTPTASRRAIFANRYSGGSWDTAVGLTSGVFNTAGEVFAPDLAMDNAGNAVAVWNEKATPASRGAVYTSRFTVPALGNPAWGASEVISASNVTVYNPKVVLDANGFAQAVWAQEDAAQVTSIWSNRFSVSTAWGSATRIHTGPLGNAEAQQLAVDPTTGTVLALWLLRAPIFAPDGVWANFLR